MRIHYKNLVLDVPDSVYQPAEDSFMLAEAAVSVLASNCSKHKTRDTILDLGCGSGIVSLACASADSNCSVLGVDINPDAVRCSQENAKRNGIANAQFIESDLFSELPKDPGSHLFDLIIFNPPYLPTADDERVEGALNHAFDGGSDGREVVDRFLEDFDKHLAPKGTLLLVQSSLNDEGSTIRRLAGLGYVVKVVANENFFFEKLGVLKAQRRG